jgi:hypothetical protein
VSKFKAAVFEFERGWGSKLDYVKEFDTVEERDQFIREFNSENTAPTAPDWYMTAQALN